MMMMMMFNVVTNWGWNRIMYLVMEAISMQVKEAVRACQRMRNGKETGEMIKNGRGLIGCEECIKHLKVGTFFFCILGSEL